MFLTTLLIFCCTSISTDAPKASRDPSNLNSQHIEETVAAANRQPALPDAPMAKIDYAAGSDSTASPAEIISPKSEPFSLAPVKPAMHGSYETPRQRNIWIGLMAAGHSAAVYDAYSTRQAISGGYGVESDPLLRPFSHSNAMYAATQVSPAVMDYLGHRMMSSEHGWMRRLWWVPQIAGTSLSLSAGIHNSRLLP